MHFLNLRCNSTPHFFTCTQHLYSPFLSTQQPFRLQNNAISEGRPDLVNLLNAREPHEKLIREGTLERRLLAEQVRDDARARLAAKAAAKAVASPTGEPEGVTAARYGLNTLGFVPPGMVASGTLNALAAGMRVGPGGEQVEPNKRARPPATVGLHPVRPRTLDRVRPDLQAIRQHDFSRSDKAATLALNSSGAWETAVGGWQGDSGGGVSVEGSANGSAAVGVSSSVERGGLSGGGDRMGDGGGGSNMVRVGVPVEDIISERRAYSAMGGSRRPLPSPLHPRTPWGTIRTAEQIAESARNMPALVQPQRGEFFSPGEDEDYVVSTDHPVAFKVATKDLPSAAVSAVRSMLADHHTLTVSGIHQRRPPYLDVGNPSTLASIKRELHPSQFTAQLRRNEDDAFRTKKKCFILGATAPWNKSKHMPAGLDTFDFMAKHTAIRYYITDFTEPSGPPMRPPTRGTTRFAANVPSMLSKSREGPIYAARDVNKLMCVAACYV